MADRTFQWKERMWMENLAENMPIIRGGRDIRELPKCGGSAVVVGAGPSVERCGHLKTLAEGYEGTIISTDKMLVPCLREEISPDIVVTADGDPSIAGFYDDPLVSAGGRTVAVLNALTVHPDTVAKCPYERFWYMTPVDDPMAERSVTRAVHFMTGKTILSSFGNVGGMAVNLALFLGANPVVMVGMDYGYTEDTPLEKTSYYRAYAGMAEAEGRRVEDYFKTVTNPDTGQRVVLDMNWGVYRDIFLKHMRLVAGKASIVNCSPTSSLFGFGVAHVPLEEALKRWPR